MLLQIRHISADLAVVSSSLLAPKFSAVEFFAGTGLPESRLLQLPPEILALILDYVFEPWHLESFAEDKDYAHACADAKYASSKPPCRGPLLTCKTFYELLKDKPRSRFSGTIYYHYREGRRMMFRFARPAPQKWQWIVPMVKTVCLPEIALSALNFQRLWEATYRSFPSLRSIEFYQDQLPINGFPNGHPNGQQGNITTGKVLPDSMFLNIALVLVEERTRSLERYLPLNEDNKIINAHSSPPRVHTRCK